MMGNTYSKILIKFLKNKINFKQKFANDIIFFQTSLNLNQSFSVSKYMVVLV